MLRYINLTNPQKDYIVDKEFVIFDLDGTISLDDHRQHYLANNPKDWTSYFEACDKDAPNLPILQISKYLYSIGHQIEIWTGRCESVREKTEEWLREHYVLYHFLRMRPKGDKTSDVELKRKWLHEFPFNKNIMCVFDDRNIVVKMWREEGLTCLHVKEGDF